MTRLSVLASCLLAVSACSVESNVIAPDAMGTDSGGGMDGASFDTSIDSQTPDTSRPDTSSADSGAPDTRPLDAGARDTNVDTSLIPGSSPPPDAEVRGCEEIYDEAEEFILCFEDVSECGFSARTPTGCIDVCAANGGECLRAIDNSNEEGEECTVLSDVESCSMVRSTQLCVCTHPP